MAELGATLLQVEDQLNLILEDLECAGHLLRNRLDGGVSSSDAKPMRAGDGGEPDARDGLLENFRLHSSTIRRMLTRFQASDSGTRRFLETHVDDEWRQLTEAYTALRAVFSPGRRPSEQAEWVSR